MLLRSRKFVLPYIVTAVAAFQGTAAADPKGRHLQQPTNALAAQLTTPTLRPADGGRRWHARFARGFPTSPRFFPVAVWFESVTTRADVAKDKAVGLNTYVVLTGNSNLALLRSNGMHAAIWSNVGMGAETKAHFLSDEIDMTQGPTGCATLQTQHRLRGAGNRATWANFGKGVIFWQRDSQAQCFVNTVSIPSVDVYWMSDNDVCSQYQGGALLGLGRALTQAECHRPANYGRTIDRMRRLDAMDGRRKPIWGFVEVGRPFTERSWPTIAPAAIRAAVWHQIIAGARGITYFNHAFSGSCQTQHALREACYGAQRSVVKATNEQIRRLAPVLNAPTVTSHTSTSRGVRALYKWHRGHVYVFAGNRDNAAKTATMGLRCIGNGATAVKLGEGRERIPVAGGTFADHFRDANAIHVYRIDGGSACGLAAGAGGPARRTRVGRVPRRVSLRSGRLAVPVTCAARCTAYSRLTIRRGQRRALLTAARRRFGAGHHRLVLRLSRTDRRRVARGRVMRLRTVVVQAGGGARRTQRVRARRN